MAESNNFDLLISMEPLDANGYSSQLRQFMGILTKLSTENKLAFIRLLPKDIHPHFRGRIFELLIRDFFLAKDAYIKFTVMQFLIEFSTGSLYKALWEKVRDHCAETGNWHFYDYMHMVTLHQNRKLFNRCVGCEAG